VLKAEFRMTEDQAHKVMITAHRRGVCVVAVFTKDVAETKATRATDAGRAKGYPLLFTTEPEESSAVFSVRDRAGTPATSFERRPETARPPRSIRDPQPHDPDTTRQALPDRDNEVRSGSSAKGRSLFGTTASPTRLRTSPWSVGKRFRRRHIMEMKARRWPPRGRRRAGCGTPVEMRRTERPPAPATRSACASPAHHPERRTRWKVSTPRSSVTSDLGASST
jgi:hypothetical protein